MCFGGDRSKIAGGTTHHVLNHPDQAKLLAIFRRVNPLNTPLVQLSDFLSNNNPTTATENLDVGGTCLTQAIGHVLEVLHMAALIRTHRNAVHILLQGAIDDLAHGAVVTQMNHLAALGLQNPSHDVDGGVMPIKKRCRGDKTKRRLAGWLLQGCSLKACSVHRV